MSNNPVSQRVFFFYVGETELSAREISAFTYIVISCQSGRGVKECASGIGAAFKQSRHQSSSLSRMTEGAKSSGEP